MTYDLGETIYQKLIAIDDVNYVAMVYNAIGWRVYPIKMKDNVEYPAISFQFVGGAPREHTMSSDTGNPYGVRLQVSAWAETITEARDLQEYIRIGLQDFAGTVTGGLAIQRIFTESEAVELYSESAEVYQVIRDYMVWV